MDLTFTHDSARMRGLFAEKANPGTTGKNAATRMKGRSNTGRARRNSRRSRALRVFAGMLLTAGCAIAAPEMGRS